MSVDDRAGHAAEHHNTTEENYDASSMAAAKEVFARRTSNHLQMNEENHPNLKIEVHPEEPDHSLPASYRDLKRKEEHEAKGGPVHESERTGSIVEQIQRRG